MIVNLYITFRLGQRFFHAYREGAQAIMIASGAGAWLVGLSAVLSVRRRLSVSVWAPMVCVLAVLPIAVGYASDSLPFGAIPSMLAVVAPLLDILRVEVFPRTLSVLTDDHRLRRSMLGIGAALFSIGFLKQIAATCG